MKIQQFSVLMSVYKNDKPEDFRTAVESVSFKQTVEPSELLIVVDGPVPEELHKMIESLAEEISYIRVIWKPQNEGLGKALRDGTEAAKYEFVARMDSDDISAPYRFEKQLKAFEEDPDLSIVGGGMTEFIDTPDNIVGSREVPLTDKDIKDYMKSRCGLNHVTVMFKKSEVMKAGNYQDWFWNEDYYLWVRMMLAGCKFANLSDVLVNVRTGKDMYARRGSLKYFKSEAWIQKLMLKNRLITLPRYCFNVAVRFVVQVLMPNQLRGWLFRTVFRK